MTQASTKTQITIEHCFTVPNNPQFNTDWHAFELAKHWAEKKATELGIGTNFSDWSKITMNEDQTELAIVVTERLSEKEAREIQQRRELQAPREVASDG